MDAFLNRAGVPAPVFKNTARTLYDDVFGGPPKHSMFRDYAEIFGEVKGSGSIPFLSLGEEDDVYDVRVDYEEVFGGLDFGEFALPYEDLVEEDEEIWSSNEREKEETTFSFQAKEASSQHSNVYPPEDNNFTSVSNCSTDSKFNLSYSKANLESNLEANATAHVAELLAVPGYSIVVDDSMFTFSSNGNHDPYNMVQGGSEMKHQVKPPTSSSDNDSRDSKFDLNDTLMQNNSSCADYENEIANIHHHCRSSNCHSISSMDVDSMATKYVSASDVSLRTRPLRMPPPSRPPPNLGHTASPHINYTNNASAKLVSGEQIHSTRIGSKGHTDHQPSTESNSDISGVEIGISLAAAASAAIKEAMEVAEARIKIAKESLERKREYLYSGKKGGNEDMPPNERKVDKISRFSDPIKYKTSVKEKNHTVKMSSTKAKFTATGTIGSAASLADMVERNTILKEDKETDKFVFEEQTESIERTVHQTKEIQQIVSGSDTKSLRSMASGEGESQNWKMDQGFFEMIYNKKLINTVIFEQETDRQETEPMIKNGDGAKTVNFIDVFPSNLERHNTLGDNCIKSKIGVNVARQGNVHKVEETKEIFNKVPEASRKQKIFTESGYTAINEEGSNELEGAQNVSEELKFLGACEQASALGRIICDQKPFGSSEPASKGEGRVSEGTGKTGDGEEISNSFAECHAGGEEKTFLDNFDDIHGTEESDCTVADSTSELCERGEEMTFFSEVVTSVENESSSPYETLATRMERNEADIPTGSCEEATFREDNSNCAESECDVKESKVSRDQEENELSNLDKIPITVAKNKLSLEAELERGQAVNVLSNQYEGQEVTQQFQMEKPTAQAKASLQEDCIVRKTENAFVEAKLNYISDNSKRVISSMGNYEEHKEEVCSLDTTFNADAYPEVLQRPLDKQFNIQQVMLLEKRGNILSSTADVGGRDYVVSKKVNDNKKIEVKLKERKLERERELAEDEARKLNEEKDRQREREKDSIGAERATQEAREAKERSERFVVEKMTADFRLRAFKEARQRAEKASAEAHDKLLFEKAQREAVLRAERAAVERATAEARERFVEMALAEKAAMDTKESTGKYTAKSSNKNGPKMQFQNDSSSSSSEAFDGEPALRCKARFDRNQRTSERAAKALAEMNTRDVLAQREQAERNRFAENLDADVKRWSHGKEGNLRALLSTLQYILGPESSWQPIPLTDVITVVGVKKAYRKATLCVHPDKLQQRGASIQQKYICEKVFNLLKEAWNKFNSQER